MERGLLIAGLLVAAAVLFTVAYAQAASYAITLNTTKCGPGSGVLVTIAYTGSDKEAHAGDVLELHFTNSTGAPAALTVAKVFKGSVEVVDKGYAIVTLSSDADALFSMKAPEKPGVYRLSIYDIYSGALLASATLEVTQQAAVQAPAVIVQHPVVVIALLLLLAALLFYFMRLRPS